MFSAVAPWVRALALQTEALGVRIPAAQTWVVKTASVTSTAKPSAIGVSEMGPGRWPL